MEVLQNGENYKAGRNQHIHLPCAGALDAAKVTQAVKQKSKSNLFTSAAAIVDEVMREELDQEKPIDALPKPKNLTRILKMLPTKPRVKTTMGERVIWNTTTAMYPDVQLKGCLCCCGGKRKS